MAQRRRSLSLLAEAALQKEGVVPPSPPGSAASVVPVSQNGHKAGGILADAEAGRDAVELGMGQSMDAPAGSTPQGAGRTAAKASGSPGEDRLSAAQKIRRATQQANNLFAPVLHAGMRSHT